MSDLKSSELTQEERALWDAIMVREQKYIGPDDECPYSKVDWWAEKCILARRRLFAPPASRESDYYCRKCHKVLMVGENHFIAEANQYVCGPWDYSRKSPAKEESNMGTGEFVTDERGAWEKCSRPDCDLRVISRGKAVCGYGCHEPASEEKVECPNCGDGITAIDNHQKQKALVGGGQITVYTCQPAQPELGSEAFDKRVRAGAAKIALGSAGFSQPEPAATEMPEGYRDAILFLRGCGRFSHADALETFWRDHIAQPVGITAELEMALEAAAYGARRDEEEHLFVAAIKTRSAIASVREQYGEKE